MQDLSSLTRDQTHTPLHWKCRVLTTGSPGKSHSLLNFYKDNPLCSQHPDQDIEHCQHPQKAPSSPSYSTPHPKVTTDLTSVIIDELGWLWMLY